MFYADATGPERCLVGHPFNPVYLLPLVEACAGERTAPRTVERAAALYRAVGMRPLVVRKGSTASWPTGCSRRSGARRYGSWPTGVATVEEVDDAIRLGAGLRWACMGSLKDRREVPGSRPRPGGRGLAPPVVVPGGLAVQIDLDDRSVTSLLQAMRSA